MERAERRKQRIRLMHKLNALELLRCAKCGNGRGDYEEMNCNCKAAVAIRDIGAEFSRDDSKITVEKYRELSTVNKLSDREIGRKFGVSNSTIHYFKVKHGIAKKENVN